MTSRWGFTLSDQPPATLPALELDDGVGQRTATFEFDVVDIITGYRRTVNPVNDQPASLSHDTRRVIKRVVSGLRFGVADTAMLNTVSSRLEIFMRINNVPYPLGQYIFNDQTEFVHTSGNLSSASLYDNGFIVDQDLEHSFPGLQAFPEDPTPVDTVINQLLAGLPITYTLEDTSFTTVGSWSGGASRGSSIEELALDGDYYSPWFDNTNVMRFIRVFDPALAVPTFDLDAGNRVLTDPPPALSSDLLTAPNRFIIISNGSVSNPNVPVFGTYDVPSSAPHSIANRGFVVPAVYNRQVDNDIQAQALARNVGQRKTLFQRVELHTPPDPRHDSYDVLRWQGANWLELAWTLVLEEGAPMTHVARRAYAP